MLYWKFKLRPRATEGGCATPPAVLVGGVVTEPASFPPLSLTTQKWSTNQKIKPNRERYKKKDTQIVHFHVGGRGFIGTLLELYWGRSELYWYGVATLLLRYCYVIATLLLRYRYVCERKAMLLNEWAIDPALFC